MYISSTCGIATQEGVRIQQRDQNSTAKEGHNSTKNPLNIDPGSVFNWGGQNFILHRHYIGSVTVTTHHDKLFFRIVTEKSNVASVNFFRVTACRS